MDYFVRFVSVARVVAGNEVVVDVASFQLTCWDGKTGDLEHLLGRKPTTAAEFLRANYAARQV